MTPRVHVHVHVSDLARSREFYARFLGGPPVKDKPGYVKFLPDWAPVNLALSAGGAAAAGAVDHLGIQVDATETVVRHLARVKAAGLPVREEMAVDCCHANQDKFWVTDPDGVQWEVYHLNYDLEAQPAPARAGGLALAPAASCCGAAAPASAGARATADRGIREIVREKYGQAALRVTAGGGSCCGASSREADPITSNLYAADETRGLPAEAVSASLGCGNPTALAELRPGEVVLDLGSGGGIDVLLSARRVGPAGRAYGLDMTDEMLALARANQAKAGVANVEFLKGEIEHVPLPDASVDVIISNCVINLSADKDRVLAEAFRVLRPGGRLAVSDVVVRGEVPPAIRRSVELWIGCVAGALEEAEYRDKLAKAGFAAIDVEPTRVYRAEDAREVLAGAGLDPAAVAAAVDGKFMSAFIRATKPRA